MTSSMFVFHKETDAAEGQDLRHWYEHYIEKQKKATPVLTFNIKMCVVMRIFAMNGWRN